jgi:hypothetical protein
MSIGSIVDRFPKDVSDTLKPAAKTSWQASNAHWNEGK